jgi:hypothetical protein
VAAAAWVATGAHAEVQVWKLTGTVYDEITSQGTPFVPPSSYYAHGKTVTVQYVIDTGVTTTDGSSTYSAVQSFTLNGVGSKATGYISADGGGLNAINESPTTPRADKVTFLSFNRFGGPKATSVSDALTDFSVATAAGVDADYRVDFGSAGSVRVKPTSFTKVILPAHCSSPLYRLIDAKCAPLRPIK